MRAPSAKLWPPRGNTWICIQYTMRLCACVCVHVCVRVHECVCVCVRVCVLEKKEAPWENLATPHLSDAPTISCSADTSGPEAQPSYSCIWLPRGIFWFSEHSGLQGPTKQAVMDCALFNRGTRTPLLCVCVTRVLIISRVSASLIFEPLELSSGAVSSRVAT